MNLPAMPMSFRPKTISLSASAAMLPQPIPALWRRSARFVATGCAALAIILLTVAWARATDVVIINGTGCQVTEEDAVGP